MIRSIALWATLLTVISIAGPLPGGEGTSFVLRAGKIYPVSSDLPWILEDGVIIVREGHIVAIGTGLPIPSDLLLIELPDAVVIPGLVAATSGLAGVHRGDESMAAGYLAVDTFDRHRNFARTLAMGVTTVHLNPGGHRLLTGQGAVVKLAPWNSKARRR